MFWFVSNPSNVLPASVPHPDHAHEQACKPVCGVKIAGICACYSLRLLHCSCLKGLASSEGKRMNLVSGIHSGKGVAKISRALVLAAETEAAYLGSGVWYDARLCLAAARCVRVHPGCWCVWSDPLVPTERRSLAPFPTPLLSPCWMSLWWCQAEFEQYPLERSYSFSSCVSCLFASWWETVLSPFCRWKRRDFERLCDLSGMMQQINGGEKKKRKRIRPLHAI